jgi:hypothetical protein
MAFGPIEDESTGKQPKPVVFTLVHRVLLLASYYLLPDLPMKLSNHSLFLLTFAFHILTTRSSFLFCKDFLISAGHALLFLLASCHLLRPFRGGFATQMTMKMEAIKA